MRFLSRYTSPTSFLGGLRQESVLFQALLLSAISASACESPSKPSIQDEATQPKASSAQATPVAKTAALEPVSSKRQAEVVEQKASASEEQDPMLRRLEQSMHDTPFTAVVRQVSVKVREIDAYDQEHVYLTHVIRSIRGQKLEKLHYVVSTEKGEKPMLKKEPFIVTLCRSSDGEYYWPGVGASFELSASTEEVLQRVTPQLDSEQKEFADCQF